MTALALRFIFTSALFLPFIKWPSKKTIWTIFQISMLMNVLHIGTLFIGLKMLDAASISVLLQTQVIFATLLGCIFFKEKIRWKTWTGIAVAFLGIIVMLGAPDLVAHPQGVFVMLFSTFVLALSYVKMKHLQVVHLPTYIFLTNIFAVPFALGAALYVDAQSWIDLPQANWNILAPVFLFQVVLVSLSHALWQKLMRISDVGKLSATTLVSPFIVGGLSVLILGETLTIPMIVGGLLTMAGVGIITLRRIQKGI
jgi:O-acetylserine/cysteine efflux transporter